MRRVLLLLPLLVVAACSLGPKPPPPPTPAVTFIAATHSVTTHAAQFCDVKVTMCTPDPTAQAVLRVPPGSPLTVVVPPEVSAAPWQIVFAYHAPGGARTEARTAVFPPGSTGSYTLVLPAPTDQLETAEVQQYGAAMTSTPNGTQFATRGTWVLSVDTSKP